ncbi:endonuclease III [Candidatus Blochmanniella floridana]|uniref:Endonuclease III n=1 Tax=Blochmanniella floridana TaxID=203907 RepID=Q7VR51_BLOFL|nr:endonuclease III [Candidatus Blochmannia floridanus]
MNNLKRYQILCRLKNYNYDMHDQDDLVYHSVFECLVATLLSAQARDVQVNKITKNLFKIANTPQSMLNLGVDGVKQHIKCIGLFNSKSENLIKICNLLINQYNGIVPKKRLELESLPGIGRKTANIILNVCFGLSTIAVDTHVFRFCNRSCFASGHNVIAVERKLMSVVPREFKRNCHRWLVKHGRYTCKSKNPDCNNCIINDLCEFDKKWNI